MVGPSAVGRRRIEESPQCAWPVAEITGRQGRRGLAGRGGRGASHPSWLMSGAQMSPLPTGASWVSPRAARRTPAPPWSSAGGPWTCGAGCRRGWVEVVVPSSARSTGRARVVSPDTGTRTDSLGVGDQRGRDTGAGSRPVLESWAGRPGNRRRVLSPGGPRRDQCGDSADQQGVTNRRGWSRADQASRRRYRPGPREPRIGWTGSCTRSTVGSAERRLGRRSAGRNRGCGAVRMGSGVGAPVRVRRRLLDRHVASRIDLKGPAHRRRDRSPPTGRTPAVLAAAGSYWLFTTSTGDLPGPGPARHRLRGMGGTDRGHGRRPAWIGQGRDLGPGSSRSAGDTSCGSRPDRPRRRPVAVHRAFAIVRHARRPYKPLGEEPVIYQYGWADDRPMAPWLAGDGPALRRVDRMPLRVRTSHPEIRTSRLDESGTDWSANRPTPHRPERVGAAGPPRTRLCSSRRTVRGPAALLGRFFFTADYATGSATPPEPDGPV